MSSSAYTLPFSGQITDHTRWPVLLVRDGTDNISSRRQEIEACVRSGDFLVTLATQLDTLSDELTLENEVQAALLQQIVDDLMYLERRQYTVTKK